MLPAKIIFVGLCLLVALSPAWENYFWPSAKMIPSSACFLKRFRIVDIFEFEGTMPRPRCMSPVYLAVQHWMTKASVSME